MPKAFTRTERNFSEIISFRFRRKFILGFQLSIMRRTVDMELHLILQSSKLVSGNCFGTKNQEITTCSRALLCDTLFMMIILRPLRICRQEISRKRFGFPGFLFRMKLRYSIAISYFLDFGMIIITFTEIYLLQDLRINCH